MLGLINGIGLVFNLRFRRAVPSKFLIRKLLLIYTNSTVLSRANESSPAATLLAAESTLLLIWLSIGVSTTLGVIYEGAWVIVGVLISGKGVLNIRAVRSIDYFSFGPRAEKFTYGSDVC